MEAIEVKTGIRNLEIVTIEAEKLNKLIVDREVWLADPLNKSRLNYAETNSDTQKMIWDLKELQDEIQELKKAQ